MHVFCKKMLSLYCENVKGNHFPFGHGNRWQRFILANLPRIWWGLYLFSIGAIANCHKLNGLKKHEFIILYFYSLDVCSLDKSHQDLKSRDCQGCIPSWRLHFLLIFVVGRIWFLAVIGLKSPFSYWLLAERCSQFLETSTFLCSCPLSSIFKDSNGKLSPS